MTHVSERVALYRFYDAAGALLYVGITNSPSLRWAQHAADKPWFGDVAHKTVEWYEDRDAAEVAEVRAIRGEQPRYNIAHNENNPHRVTYQKLGSSRARPRTRRISRRRSRKVKAWYAPLSPLLPLFLLGLMMWRAAPELQVLMGLTAAGVVTFLFLAARFWGAMWRNVRELWR